MAVTLSGKPGTIGHPSLFACSENRAPSGTRAETGARSATKPGTRKTPDQKRGGCPMVPGFPIVVLTGAQCAQLYPLSLTCAQGESLGNRAPSGTRAKAAKCLAQ